jgi:hypothetical protein
MLLLSYDVVVITAVIPAATATYFAAAVAFADVDRLICFDGYVVLICQCGRSCSHFTCLSCGRRAFSETHIADQLLLLVYKWFVVQLQG